MSLYGSVLWDLSGRLIDLFYTAWRKAVRKIISVHPRTHCALLPLIISSAPIDITLKNRFINFLRKASNTQNYYIKIAYRLVQNGSGSLAYNSLSFISNTMGVPRSRVETFKCVPFVRIFLQKRFKTM
jgi:hypothetical protein